MCPVASEEKKLTTLEKISQWLQYIYFLRFSILAWLFLPILLLLDGFGKTTSITRGIFTMENGWQAYNAAFFILALNMTVLITARNIIRNGPDRFISGVPQTLNRALCTNSPRAMWLTLFFVHVPTLATVYWLYRLANHEQVKEDFRLNLLAGLLAGMVFWFLVSLFYYWTYRSKQERSDPSALIFPESPNNFFGRVTRLDPPRLAWIEKSLYPLLKLTHKGYASSPDGPLWELHFFSAVSFLGFFLLYIFLYPSTAPVPRPDSFHILRVVAAVIFMLLVAVILSAGSAGNSLARAVKTIFFLTAVVLFLSFLWFNRGSEGLGNRLELAFPTLASILVIATFSLWFLTGLSFLLDRYRVSVVAVSAFLIFIPKQCTSNSGEHYYAVRQLKDPVNAPSPAEVLEHRSANVNEPYIIVTASGGGIHAAAWTSRVMYTLEASFANDKDLAGKYTFHDHLLLASGVSGGSVGLMPFLLEYKLPPTGAFSDSNLKARITAPPSCSSLEAVAWGMAYYDLYRFVLPSWFPSPWPPYEGPDRSWALAEAFNRNLQDPNCNPGLSGKRPDGDDVALYDAARLLAEGNMPAFTFNTTSEETGNRFLLSNYTPPLPPPNPRGLETNFVPSQSFLEVYAQKKACEREEQYCSAQKEPAETCEKIKAACDHPAFADLPLATAARLSATFPYVSSGTRIPPQYSAYAYHFLDGGYFDNDGTASVIEFLKSALGTPNDSGPRRKILLLEIRDGGDLDQESEDDEFNQSTRAKDWTSGAQLTAPPKGLWNAGHVSISRRNRRELCLLEQAYHSQLAIHHIVFPIYMPKGETQPLSWKLTPRQLDNINQWVVDKGQVPNEKFDESLKWIKEALKSSPDTPPAPDNASTNCYVFQ